MAALPGLTSISLTKDRTKALVSVSSLVLRNSLISSTTAAMVSIFSAKARRSESSARASSARISSFHLTLPVLLDAVGGVGHLDVGGLDDLPDAPQPPLHVLKLLLDALKLLPLLTGHLVHLLIQQLHQVPDIGLGEYALPDLVNRASPQL